MIPDSFHWLRPAWLAALLLLAPLLWALRRGARAGGPWERLCDAHLLRHLLDAGAPGAARWPLALVALGWTAACLALAGPTWERMPETAYRTPARTVFVLGLSPSMNRNDVRPSRLARARFEIEDALDRSAGGSVALVVYREEGFAVTPLTDDGEVLREQLPLLRTSFAPGSSVRPARGIDEARQLLARVGIRGARILLVSDGSDDDPAATREAARRAAAEGARVSVLSIAGDSEPLAAVAQAGGGSFATLAADESDLDRVLSDPTPVDAPALARSDVQADRWRDLGAWLVWVPLLLAPIAFRKGWAGAVVAALWISAAPLSARADALDWFQRPDQRAARDFDEGRFAEAAAAFRDPAWQAAARYRAGDFAGASAALAGAEDPNALYNRGNALARAGQLEEAIASYDRSLAARPSDADARFNRDLVQRLLDQRRRQAQDSGSQGDRSGAEASSGEGERGDEGREGDARRDPGGTKANDGSGDDSDAGAKDAAAGAEDPGREAAADSASPRPGSDADASAGAKSGADAEAQEPAPGSEPAEASAGEPENASDDTDSTGGRDARDLASAGDARQPADGAAGEEARSQARAGVREGEPGDARDAASSAPGDAHDTGSSAPGASASHAPSAKEQQMAQWMARLPDDPGGLLRERMRRDYLRKRDERRGEQP